MDKIYKKSNVELTEYMLIHSIGSLQLVKTPKIYDYDLNTKIMKMELINGSNVSDFYGENDQDTPKEIYTKIRNILSTLFNAKIEYIDITGYNFIIDENNDIWVIDFEHAYVRTPQNKQNQFLKKFLNGFDGWNPAFK